MEQHGTARQVTDKNIIRHKRFGFWIPEVTDKHSEYIIFTDFPRNYEVMWNNMVQSDRSQITI